MTLKLSLPTLLLCSLLPWTAAAQEKAACMAPVSARYELNPSVKPDMLRADFDGDGTPDTAVAIRRKQSNEQGILICRSGGGQAVVLGAGTAFNDMKNLDFGLWELKPKRRVPKSLGTMLYVEWPERASALIYWNGKRFMWYQQGD